MCEYDKFFTHCQKTNRPFIKARKNLDEQNYFVLLDLITCQYYLSKKDQKILNSYSKKNQKIKNQLIKKLPFKDLT